MCVCERENVCVFVREKERECVCVSEREIERESNLQSQVKDSKPLSLKEVSLFGIATETFVPLKVERERVIPFRNCFYVCACVCVCVCVLVCV